MTELYDKHFWIGILLSIFCGIIVGLERQLRGKPVGIRTSILIIIGTITYLRVGHMLDDPKDPTRVLGQIITGIGFIGAGVIMNKEGLVVGVTSAALVWVLASVGALIGFKFYSSAVIISLLSVTILVGVEYFERKIGAMRTGVHAHVSSNRKSGN